MTSCPGCVVLRRALFVPLFFASAGLHLDLSFVSLPGQTIAALLFIPMLGKLVGAFVSIYAARLDTPLVLTTGLMAKGVAEIALLIVLYETQVISHDVFFAIGAPHARVHFADAPNHRLGDW